jgi:hypothetical protein
LVNCSASTSTNAARGSARAGKAWRAPFGRGRLTVCSPWLRAPSPRNGPAHHSQSSSWDGSLQRRQQLTAVLRLGFSRPLESAPSSRRGWRSGGGRLSAALVAGRNWRLECALRRWRQWGTSRRGFGRQRPLFGWMWPSIRAPERGCRDLIVANQRVERDVSTASRSARVHFRQPWGFGILRGSGRRCG